VKCYAVYFLYRWRLFACGCALGR